MEIHLQVGRRHLVVLAVLAAAVLGGVAYAAIPDAGGVFTACQLNANGSLRLIDPSLSSGPLSRCWPNETQVQWNQQGQPGANGKDGSSPTVAQLAANDSHCPSGGASITDASGNVAYVCNGADGQQGVPGKDGAPFDGTFTSPNGQFSLSVADSGVSIIGPDRSITMPATTGGEILIQANDLNTQVAHDQSTTVGHDRVEAIGNDATASVGNNQTITIGGNRTETVHKSETTTVDLSRTQRVGSDDSLTVSGNRTEHVGASLQLQAGAAATFLGNVVLLGDSSACKPAARVGDLVSSTAILTGSATVCIGG